MSFVNYKCLMFRFFNIKLFFLLSSPVIIFAGNNLSVKYNKPSINNNQNNYESLRSDFEKRFMEDFGSKTGINGYFFSNDESTHEVISMTRVSKVSKYVHTYVNKNDNTQSRKLDYAIKTPNRGVRFVNDAYCFRLIANRFFPRTYYVSGDRLECGVDAYGSRCITKMSVILMKYYEKRDLIYFSREVLKRKTYTETACCYFGGQILNALQYMHRLKILHADIKPSNIFIDEYLNVMLADFSVSIPYKDSSFISQYSRGDLSVYLDNIKVSKRNSIGTTEYMSPEILLGIPFPYKSIEKIDVFSFGVLMYYLASGEYPFKIFDLCSNLGDSATVKEIERIFKEDANFKLLEDNCSCVFIDVIKKCLQFDINKRPTIDDLANHPFFSILYPLLKDEREKMYNANKFLIYMITDMFRPYDTKIAELNDKYFNDKNSENVCEIKEKGDVSNVISSGNNKNKIKVRKNVISSGNNKNKIKVRKLVSIGRAPKYEENKSNTIKMIGRKCKRK